MKLRILLPLVGFALVGVLMYSYSASAEGASISARRETRAAFTSPLASAIPRLTLVRFVNALPGSAPLEVGRDSAMLFANVVFGAVSPYTPLSAGAHHFTLRHPASTQNDAVSKATLLEGERYTVLALTDTAGHSQLRVILDELAPDSGMARVRVINAAAGVDRVVVRLRGGDDPFLTAVNGTSVAQVRDVSPTSAGFSLRTAANVPLATIQSVALLQGVSYTFVITSRPRSAATTISIVDR